MYVIEQATTDRDKDKDKDEDRDKDEHKDKDEDKDKEEERLEFYSQLANCWWVGGGQKSDLRRPVDPALHY